MRTLLILLLATAGCRDVDHDLNSHGPVSSKPVEHAPATDNDHEYSRVRSSFEQSSRDRLSKLDARIHELEQSANASAHQTAAELRRDRDELAARIDQIRTQEKPNWDAFQSRVEDSFQQLEKRIDDAVHD